MLTRRVIVCLDVSNGRVVKGTRFIDMRDMGAPADMAAHYEAAGADEIVFLDISASSEDRSTLFDVATETAERLFIPLTIGGGLRSVRDAHLALRSGADKVSFNSAAVERPRLLTAVAERFGAQSVVASIDAKRTGDRWRVHTHGGRRLTTLDAVEWAVECAELGAGEILLTSIDRDGSRDGYDIELTRAVASAVSVPVVASGGAGCAAHVVEAFTRGCGDAALVAGILHDGTTTITDLKIAMATAGLAVRVAA
jgi:cyclase